MRRHAFASAVAGLALGGFAGSALAQSAMPPPADAPLELRPTVPGDPSSAGDAAQGRVVRELPLTVTDGIDTGAVTAGIRRTASAVDPYDPLGIRTGGYILYPSLTVAQGDTSNAASAAGGSASTYAILAPEFLLRSDWARHAASFDLRGSYQHFFSTGADDRPEVDATATGRVDVSDAWTVPLSAAYTFRTQALSDPNFPAGVDYPPGVHDFRAAVGVNRTGPLLFQAEGSLERAFYANGTAGGSVVDQGDRNNFVAAGRVRLGYELTPSLAPFVEAKLGRRVFDRTVDANGLRRSGILQFYRAGIAVDRSPVLTGEVAGGYGIATFDDPTLAAIRGFAVDGNLVWAPTELTSITLAGTTSFNPGTNPISSGSVVYDGSVALAYAWRRNATLNVTLGARNERFQGTGVIDTDARAGLSATWKVNRMLWVTATYEHEWLRSNAAGRDFASDAVRLEVKAQR